MSVKYKDEDLIGKRFGRLVVLNIFSKISKRGWKARYARCRCDCGTEKDVAIYNLISGSIISCSCQSKLNRIKELTTHNLSKHPLYRKFFDMKKRCYNKNSIYYGYYGGKGIKIYQDWLDHPENFVKWGLNNGWKKELTIDRIDYEGDYTPENCRFVPMNIQCINKGKRKDNTSEYIGIKRNNRDKLWVATINVNGKRIYLGSSKDKHKALDERNDYIKKHKLVEYAIQEWKGE